MVLIPRPEVRTLLLAEGVNFCNLGSIDRIVLKFDTVVPITMRHLCQCNKPSSTETGGYAQNWHGHAAEESNQLQEAPKGGSSMCG